MKKIIANSLFAIRTLIVVLCVVCGAVPAWAGHDTHYARVTVTASPTGQGKVYMTTDGDYVPEDGDWQNSMSATWNCNDDVNNEADSRTYYVHAQPTSGNHFVKWSSNGSDSKSTDAKYAYSTSAQSESSGSPTANSLYAIFAVNPEYTCTFLTSENGTFKYKYGDSEEVTVESQHYVTTNQNFTFTALPAAGYELYGWYTESGGTKTYFDYSSYSLPSYALPGNVRIGVDFMPIGTPLFQIKGAAAVYTDLNAAVMACDGAAKTIVLINNGTLPAGEYTIPTNVTLLIPFDAVYTCYTETPGTIDSYTSPTAYRTLTMSPGARLIVNGKISLSAKVSGKSYAGPCGAPSESYGAIKMLSEGETKSTITLNNGAKLYSWGYIYGEGAVEVLSGAEVHEGFAFMDFRGAQNTYDMTDDSHKVFPFNQYYIQNIEVPLTIHYGATEKVFSCLYPGGSEVKIPITMVGSSDGLFRLSGEGSKLTKWYDPHDDRQHYALEGNAAIRNISFTVTLIMSITVNSANFVLPITNNMDITVRSGATVSIAEDVCIMPDASVTVEQGATVNIAKNVYVYDIQAYTNAGTYTTSRGGYPSAGPGRYAAGAYVRRISYSPSWAALSDREIRRLQNMSSAHFQVNGTLTVNGKLYTTEGGADIFSAADGAAIHLVSGAGTANKTYQVDHENYDAYYYTIPVTSAKLHNADGSYQATAGNATNTTWTYAHGHWGWCIIWRLEDGTELKRMYQPAQPDDAWLSSNAPSTNKPDEGTCSYVFNGWNTVTNTSQQEIILTANYTKTCAEYYDVLWKSEDGTETYETDANTGKGETTRYNGAAPSKADDKTNGFTYTFDGWTTEPNGGGTKYNIGETPAATGDITYYAHFAATEVGATVTANGVVTYYSSIADAFTAANTSDYMPTIQVWRDATNTPALTYTAKNHCTLDLNGHTVSGTNMPLLTINDEGFTFTVTDRTETKEGRLAGTSGVSQAFVVSLVSGVFRLEAGTVYGQYTASTAMAGVYAGANREVIMTGGAIQVDANSGTGYGIFAQGKATVSGGTIRVESSAKAAYAVQAFGSKGNAIITGGYFSATGINTVTCVAVQSNASCVVQGGYFNTDTNLETFKAATCRVYSLPSTKLPYRYTVTEKTPLVASVTIGSTTTEYSSFADAWTVVNSASAASTLKLLDDVDLTTGLEYTNASKNCTLDLNGHVISGSATPLLQITQSGITFTITDLTEAKEGRIECNTHINGQKWTVEVSQSTLRFEGGTIYAKNTQAGTLFIGIYSGASGVIEISGGNIHTVTPANNPTYGVLTFGTATISSGSIQVEAAGKGYAVEAYGDNTNILITGGNFYATGSSAACVHRSKGTLTLRGGYYNSDTNLAAQCAMNYHVFPNDDATYLYKVAEGYTLSWTTDGDALTGDYTSGLTEIGTPIAAPNTPTKAGYTFYGWTPAVVAAMPSADTEYTAQWAVASVTINDATTLYTDFNTAWSAVNAATAASTIQLLQDVTVNAQLTYDNTNTQNCTLDLNGHTLTSTTNSRYPLHINNTNVTFTVTDSGASGTLLLNTTSTSTIFGVYADKGTIQLNGGTIEVRSGSATTCGATANSNGTFTMNAGTIHVVTTNSKEGRGIYSAGSVTVHDGTIHVEAAGDGYGLKRDGGTFTVNSGKFNITGSTASVSTNANPVIQGGYYNINSNLGTCVSAPYHVFDLSESELPYKYKVAEGYNVTFNANGHGAAPEAQLIEMNAHASEPTAPTATGYTFGGWYKEAACETPWNFASDVVTQATNLFAQWTVHTHKFAWDFNGGTPSGSYTEANDALAYGSVISYPTMTKTGYTFAGWSSDATTMPDNDLIITASWTINQYTISFDSNGGSAVASITQDYNTAVTTPANPSRTGYTFNGWSPAVPNPMPAEDTECEAQWTAINYSISYDLAGGSVASANPTGYTVESSAITLNNPTKANYVFAGWTGTDLASATMNVTISASSTGDRSYTATWTPAVASVSVNEATTYYTTFDDAWTAVNTATAASTLTLLQDVSITDYLQYNNSNNKNCTLNLNGHTLTSNTPEQSPLHINNANVTFTITDGTEEKAGRLSLNSSCSTKAIFGVYVQYGAFRLEEGTIEVNSGSAATHGVTVHYGTFTMNGGTIHVKTTNGKDGRGIYANSTTTVNDGTVHVEAAGTACGVRRDGGTITINGGKFNIYGSTESYINYTDAADSKLIIKGGYYTINSRLGTYVSAPYHVFDLTSGTEFDEGYRYKVAEGYTVTFKNEDETLQSGLWEKGTTPIYSGESPVKAATAQYTYTFSGWEPEVVAVTADAIYTAQFSSTVNTYTVTWKDADGTTLETDENVPYGTTPAYNGTTPTKTTDASYAYTFNGWSPTVSAVTGDATYTATYTTTPVVASVAANSTTAYYTSFAAAWTAATGAGSASTLTLLGNVAGLSASRTYSASHDLTLDLNGHTISGSGSMTSLFQISCTGHTFTVTDGSANHDGKLSFSSGSGSTSHCVIVTNGTFVLEAGMMEATSSTASIGAVKVAGGTFTMNENGAVHAIYTGNGNGKNSRAVHADGGTATINGGTIHLESEKDAIGVVYSSGNVTFNGGLFNISASGTAAVTNQNVAKNNLNIRGGYYSANTTTYFEPHVKTPYHIFSNSDATYIYRVAEAYTVTFKKGDVTLQSGLWEKGTTPTYSGETPTKPADAQYTYTFDDWSPAISSVTADATYTAQFNSTVNTYTVTWKDADGTTLETDEDVPYGTTLEYNGATPTKATDASYAYAFDTWSPEVGTVTGDVTYTATYTTTPVVASVTINSTTRYYTTLAAAWTAVNTATAASTLTLLQDVSITDYLQYNNSNNKNCTLDLNGHTLSSTTANALLYINKAGITFTITDLTESKSGTLHLESTSTDNRWCVYVAKGNLQMDAGTVFLRSKANTYNEGIRIDPAASTFTMNGGKVHVETSDGKPARGIVSRGIAVINDGEIQVEASGTGYGIEARVSDDGNNIGNVTVNGGKFLVTGTTAACVYRSDTKATLKLQGGYYNINSNLETCVAAPYSVQELDPPYEEAGKSYGYAVVLLPQDITVDKNQTVTISSNTTAITTTVHISGTLNVEDGVTLTTTNLILEASENASGEIMGSVTATNAYFDLSHEGGFKARTWYAVAVPWKVFVKAYQVNGVYLKIGDEYVRQKLGETYDLIYYDGARRATGVNKAWTYVEDYQKAHPTEEPEMKPGVAYMIYLTSDADTIRFEKRSNATLHTNNLYVNTYKSSIDAAHANWNGIANPATYHAYVNVGATDGRGQVYNAETKQYELFKMDEHKLVVGQPIFVQPPLAGPVEANSSSYNPSASAPRRAKEQVSLTRYELMLAASDADVSDRVIVRMDEEKTENEYVIGQDLVKMGVSDMVPQMWINRYEKKMCVNTIAGYANTADYPLSIFAPKNGDYDLFIDDQPDNETMLYLTYDGEAIWNLSYGGYVASLEKGTNTHYGLRIVKKAPQITTGIEETTIRNGEMIRKVLVNNKVYIIRNGQTYSVTGQKAN